ncbi:hypothetical protein [Solilutibacter oculi]|nr:hypothetical protein [Lysobacter oculi]
MKLSRLAPIALCVFVAACSQSAPEAQPAANNTAPTDAATQTEAVYGDEAPVAIAAEQPKAEEGHAHNEDGSHPEGVEHADEAKAEGDHAHEAGEPEDDH